MTLGTHDFAIIGSTPLAGLLAGLLASEHRKRVILVGAGPSPLRLPTGIDVSIVSATRPETWSLVTKGAAEMRKILGRMGAKHGFARLDPAIAAVSPEGNAALAHMRHVALGYGVAVERLSDGLVPEGGSAFLMRDITVLDRALLAAPLAAWLENKHVTQVFERQASIEIEGSGAARITRGSEVLEATRSILADDDAVLAFGGPATLALLQPRPREVLLTEPCRPPLAPVMQLVDRDLLVSHYGTEGLTAFADGALPGALAELGGMLKEQRSLRRAGRRRMRTLASKDGAPVVGGPYKGGPFAIAGLGNWGAFMAPALARYIAGSSSAAEEDYFASRGVESSRSEVGDYVPRFAGAEEQAA